MIQNNLVKLIEFCNVIGMGRVVCRTFLPVTQFKIFGVKTNLMISSIKELLILFN